MSAPRTASNDLERHFIIFERTSGHCAAWLLRAPNLGAAMAKFVVEYAQGAELLPDGSIRVDDGYGGKLLYSHPLECFESECKSEDGSDGNGWDIQEITDGHWDAGLAEVLCSADPRDIDGHIARCRPVFRQAFPGSRARAFVWYLKDGPLVTFHRRQNPKKRWRIEVMARYLLPWNEWGRIERWHGTLDAILHDMAVEVPLPQRVGTD